MSGLIKFQAAAVTSQDIADLVGSRHDNVKRTIERLVARGVIAHPPMEDSEVINNLGLASRVTVYRFAGDEGKRDSIVVVAQLSPEFTARLVDRWQALEAAAMLQIPNTLPDALRLAADLADENQRLGAVVAEQAPKVAALTRIAEADGSLCLRETAKALQVPERRFAQLLHSWGWIFKPHGGRSWLGYADKTKAGWLTHKVTEVRGSDGGMRIAEQVRFTPSGVTKLAELLASEVVLA